MLEPVVVGVDGTKAGWIAIALEDGRFAGDYLLRPATSDFAAVEHAAVIAIDVPVGYGPRQADRCARSFLSGGARGAVFAVPSEETLLDALKEKTFRAGLGVSAQLHGIAPRIVHVTTLVATRSRMYEVHPEVSFRAMNECRPLRHGKKTYGGVRERLALLRAHQIELDDLGHAASVPVDDVLDAAAAAWSAARIERHEAKSLPDPPEKQGVLEVAIWY